MIFPCPVFSNKTFPQISLKKMFNSGPVYKIETLNSEKIDMIYEF